MISTIRMPGTDSAWDSQVKTKEYALKASGSVVTGNTSRMSPSRLGGGGSRPSSANVSVSGNGSGERLGGSGGRCGGGGASAGGVHRGIDGAT